jgi:hypothetical protein
MLDTLRSFVWRVKRWLASFRRVRATDYPGTPWHAAWFQAHP